MGFAKAARFLLYCLLIWAPLPLGSNRPIFWAINGIVATVILGLFLAGELNAEQPAKLDWRPAAWGLSAFSIWVIWSLVQVLPGLPAFLHHPIWAEFSDELPEASGTISISPSATWKVLAQITPIVFLSVVAMRLSVDRRQGKFLLKLIVATTTGMAIYGLAALFLGFRQVFLLDTVANEGFLTGTFVGRNAAATYFVIGLASASSLFANEIESRFGSAHAARSAWSTLAKSMRHSSIYVGACVILAVGVTTTGSRAGVFGCLVAIACVALLLVWRIPGNRRLAGLMFGGLAAMLIIAGIAAGGRLLPRLESDIGSDARWALFQDTFDMIRARPLLGHGAGTFAEAFPLFHTRAPSDYIWLEAHNSYLQAMAEIGIPVFTVVMVGAGIVLAYIVRGVTRGTGPMPVAVTAVSAAAGVAAQSLVDFTIQIQAIGLTLFILVGAGLGEIASRSARLSSEK